MKLIKKKVEFAGNTKSETIEATIDSGAEISIIDKTTARRLGLESTGQTTTLVSYDGNKKKAEIYKGRAKIHDTCCEAETEFVAVNDDELIDGPIIGKDFISKTGMTINGSKKDESNISCDCGKAVSEIKEKLSKLKKREKSG